MAVTVRMALTPVASLATALAVDPKTSPLPLRYSAIIMCSLFLIGLVTLPFAPETKGKPLPQE